MQETAKGGIDLCVQCFISSFRIVAGLHSTALSTHQVFLLATGSQQKMLVSSGDRARFDYIIETGFRVSKKLVV